MKSGYTYIVVVMCTVVYLCNWCLVVIVTEASTFIQLSRLLTHNHLSVVSVVLLYSEDILHIFQVLNNAATEL